MKQKKMKPIAWVAVSLILILVSCIGASLIQTDFGSVTITDVRLPMAGRRDAARAGAPARRGHAGKPRPCRYHQPWLPCNARNAGYHLHRTGAARVRGVQHGYIQRGQFVGHHHPLQRQPQLLRPGHAATGGLCARQYRLCRPGAHRHHGPFHRWTQRGLHAGRVWPQ